MRKPLHLIACLLLTSLVSVVPAASRNASAQAPAAGSASSTDLQSRAPALVMIIRHAEKPPKGQGPDLTAAGQARADKLSTLFVTTPERAASFPRPDFIFATALSTKSHRPVETVTPMSKTLHLKLDATFAGDQNEQLAKEVLSGKYAGKVVLICWHHGDIPALTADFGVQNPPRWADETFDQVWQMRWVNGTVNFTTAPEALMPGDSAK